MTSDKNWKRSRIYTALVLAVVLFFSICCAGVLIKHYYNRSNQSKKAYVSVYEKLSDGAPINVLIVGDSIAAGTGASSGNSWASLLPTHIEQVYGSNCNVVNISMGGNSSIAGTVRVMALDDNVDYDLAIICYGENDADDSAFAANYESIIRSIKSRYGNCNIISLLESSQRDYTNKMNQIIDIADFYDIPVADTIKAFKDSGCKYEELVNAPDDLTHPNDKGHAVYLDAVLDVIGDRVSKASAYVGNMNPLDNMIYLKRSDFRRIGVTAFETTIKPCTANIGIYRSNIPGSNGLSVYSDNELVFEQNFEWEYPFGQEHIDQLTDEPIELGEKLTIKFASIEEAKYFKGAFFIVD